MNLFLAFFAFLLVLVVGVDLLFDLLDALGFFRCELSFLISDLCLELIDTFFDYIDTILLLAL